MTTVIEATFDGSVFRPSGPVTLAPNTPVRLIVESRTPVGEAKRSFLETARGLNLEGPADWSANLDHYLYGGDRPSED
jgi:hypothetical protein